MSGRIEYVFDTVVTSMPEKVKDISSMRGVLDKCSVAGRSVLEVGCGMGDNLLYCVDSGASYAEGIDISGVSINAAAAKSVGRKNVSFKKCGIDEYSPSRKFDVILALGVFEYFEDPMRSLKKMVSFLSKDGSLVLFISKPVILKRAAAFLRPLFMLVPDRYVMPFARWLSRVIATCAGELKDKFYAGTSSTYTMEQTILEGLMVPRYNVFHHGGFCRYLSREGFCAEVMEDIAPSMTCIVARRGESWHGK